MKILRIGYVKNQKKRVHKNKTKLFSSFYFGTISHSEFTFYRNLVYPNGKKTLTPENIDQLLTGPIVLAYWFMDDGSKTPYGYYLHTDCFGLNACQYLIKVLLNKFNLTATAHIAKKKQYKIYIPASSKHSFKALIEPYIISSMLYKL
jgi:hypothetical protein